MQVEAMQCSTCGGQTCPISGQDCLLFTGAQSFFRECLGSQPVQQQAVLSCLAAGFQSEAQLTAMLIAETYKQFPSHVWQGMSMTEQKKAIRISWFGGLREGVLQVVYKGPWL